MGVHRTKLIGSGSGSPLAGPLGAAASSSQSPMDGAGDAPVQKLSTASAAIFDPSLRYASILQTARSHDWLSQPPSTQTSFQGLEALIQRTTGGALLGGHEDRLPMDLSASQHHNGHDSDE